MMVEITKDKKKGLMKISPFFIHKKKKKELIKWVLYKTKSKLISCFFFAFFSLYASQLAPPTQWDTKPTRKTNQTHC
jgi:hypothetical protein